MAYPRVAGHPDYSSSGTSKFIPEVWSGKLLVKFYDATVLGAITNTDYEGEIRDSGDKVYIRTIGDVTINNYSKGQKLSYERIESPDVEMVIDKGKYWAFTIDDVDAKQADIAWMNKWSTDASEQLKIAIDQDVLPGMISGGDVSSYNYGNTAGYQSSSYALGATGAPAVLTRANILDYIVDCGSVLDEQNIPETGRWMVIPSWCANLLKKSDIRDASFTNEGSSVLRNGRIGVIDRFTLYLSNNLYTVTDGTLSVTCTYIPFGTPAACSFATQLVKTETLRAESTFGDLIRGLQVYGYKVVKGEAMGYMYAKK
jgi:hypothetical protein